MVTVFRVLILEAARHNRLHQGFRCLSHRLRCMPFQDTLTHPCTPPSMPSIQGSSPGAPASLHLDQAEGQQADNPPWSDFLGLRWVFAYGSLIWNPEIPVIDGQLGRVDGYHRRFCISSTRYRGTKDRPGVVLGLDQGGSCRGMAWELPNQDMSSVLAQLWSREMRGGAYQPRTVKVLLRANGQAVRALCFVARRSHPAYLRLTQDEILARVHRCAGERGPNRDYLERTVAALRVYGIEDRNLNRLAAMLSGSPTEGPACWDTEAQSPRASRSQDSTERRLC